MLLAMLWHDGENYYVGRNYSDLNRTTWTFEKIMVILQNNPPSFMKVSAIFPNETENTAVIFQSTFKESDGNVTILQINCAEQLLKDTIAHSPKITFKADMLW